MNIYGDDEAEANLSSDAAEAQGGRERACPACGAAVRRAAARFCAVCGRRFDTDDYLPADALRSSYHQQRRRLPTPKLSASPAWAAANTPTGGAVRHLVRGRAAAMAAMPPQKNNNGAATTSLAFVTYALVPYLGILFCPGALLMGGIGYVRARRAPERGGGRDALLGIVLGLLVLGAQIFLWWILYKVPEWSRGGY